MAMSTPTMLFGYSTSNTSWHRPPPTSTGLLILLAQATPRHIGASYWTQAVMQSLKMLKLSTELLRRTSYRLFVVFGKAGSFGRKLFEMFHLQFRHKRDYYTPETFWTETKSRMTASFFIRFNRKEPYERISLGTEQVVYFRNKRNTIVAAGYISEKSVDVDTKLSITIETWLLAESGDVEMRRTQD